MNKFLITGRAGTGKTAVMEGLQWQHYNAIDMDSMPGLTRWEDLAGNPIQVDPRRYVDYEKVAWNWSEKILRSMLVTRKTIFFCGSASNDLELMHLFDKSFVLTVEPETQLERLRQRTSEYGKDPKQQQEILKEQAEFVKQATKIGAIPIDNNRPIKTVVAEIVEVAGV
jgi:broad-specificity NMP kinase